LESTLVAQGETWTWQPSGCYRRIYSSRPVNMSELYLNSNVSRHYLAVHLNLNFDKLLTCFMGRKEYIQMGEDLELDRTTLVCMGQTRLARGPTLDNGEECGDSYYRIPPIMSL
jgi:hypothetical protein